MAILKLHIAPDPVLAQVATPVASVTPAIQQLMDDMLETMYATHGVGLAAPQVGVSLRVIVLDVDFNPDDPHSVKKPLQLANPEVIWASTTTKKCREGCLSLPDVWDEVERPSHVKVRGLNRTGDVVTIEAKDNLLAVCLQHEIDHLNGTVFVNHLSRLKQDIALRKLQKNKKRGAYDPNLYAID